MNCLGLQYHLLFPLAYAAMKQRRFKVTLNQRRLNVDRKMPDKSKRPYVLNPPKNVSDIYTQFHERFFFKFK